MGWQLEVIGGYDVNTVDKDGNILKTEYHADINDADKAASAIDATIDHGESGGGTSMTNTRNVGGVAGLNMGAGGSSLGTEGNQSRELSKEDVKTLGKLLGKSPSGKEVIDFITKTNSKYKNAYVMGKTLENSVEGITEEASEALGKISKVEKNGNSIVVSGGTSIKINSLLNLKIKDGATFTIQKLMKGNVIIKISGVKALLNINKVEINNTSVKVNIGGINTSFNLN